MQRTHATLILQIIFVIALIAGIRIILMHTSQNTASVTSHDAEPAAVGALNVSSTPSATVPPTASVKSNATSTIKKSAIIEKPSDGAIKSSSSASDPANAVTRLTEPYTTAAFSLDNVNTRARAAIVNIMCLTSSGSIRPISGSGVMIDPKGVILTNAHVAQYVLLSEAAGIDLQCYVRTGSPATAKWIPEVLYIPPVWVDAHASEITASHVLGTGEHDYALLTVRSSVDGSPLPTSYAYLPPETRYGVSFPGDSVIAASYPAEFLGGIAATNSLYAASSPTAIKELFTFSTTSIDAISLGGVIEAQSGSSGGAIVNPWGYELGLITTTTEGATTAQRDLRAITLAYINSDIKAQTGADLAGILNGDLATRQEVFTRNVAPGLVRQLLSHIPQN